MVLSIKIMLIKNKNVKIIIYLFTEILYRFRPNFINLLIQIIRKYIFQQ
jgi:hypothetical protein